MILLVLFLLEAELPRLACQLPVNRMSVKEASNRRMPPLGAQTGKEVEVGVFPYLSQPSGVGGGSRPCGRIHEGGRQHLIFKA